MYHISRSEKQWTASFAIVNAAFWLLMIGGLIFDPESAAEGIGFAVIGFYAPFWFWLRGSVLGFMQVIITAFIGVLCHLFIGWIIGLILRKVLIKWYVTIPMAFVCIVLVIIAGNKLGYYLGIYG